VYCTRSITDDPGVRVAEATSSDELMVERS
jgi:hypothetical protein